MAASEWETVPLADVLQRPERAEAKPPNGEIPLVGVRLFGQGAYEANRKTAAEVKAATLYRVRVGDFIYNRMWATRGTFAVVPPRLDGYFATNEFPIFTADTKRLLLPYLALVAQSPSFLAEVDATAVGSTDRRRLHPERFLELAIDLPPLNEQRAIIEAVAAVDEAVTSAHEESTAAFALLDVAADALIVPAGASEDLPGDWSLKDLGDVADVRSGIAKGRKTDRLVRPRAFLRAANVQNGFLDLGEVKTLDVTDEEAARFALEVGDVLMVEGSGSPDRLGRGWIWSGQVSECIHQNHVFRARPDPTQLAPRFLAYAIATAPARGHFRASAKTTSGLSTINTTQTRALPVPLPPLETQREIVAKLDAIRAVSVEAHHLHARLQDMRTSLVDSLLSRERHVRDRVKELAPA